MNDTVEPRWVSVYRIGSLYDEEMDVNSRPTKYRHRERSFTGERYVEWKDGPAPAGK